MSNPSSFPPRKSYDYLEGYNTGFKDGLNKFMHILNEYVLASTTPRFIMPPAEDKEASNDTN